jgi:microcystin-dependent protein
MATTFNNVVFVSQLMLLPVTYVGSTTPAGAQFVRCDGKFYDATISVYKQLYSLLGFSYGGYVSGGKPFFAVPKMPSPTQFSHWYICYQGEFPQRP